MFVYMCILRRSGVVNNLKSFKYKLNPPPTILDHIMKDGNCSQILNSQSIVFFFLNVRYFKNCITYKVVHNFKSL